MNNKKNIRKRLITIKDNEDLVVAIVGKKLKPVREKNNYLRRQIEYLTQENADLRRKLDSIEYHLSKILK